MGKSRCGECHGKSEAVPLEFPFCSECDFVAATPKQFQRHVLEHERVWWIATMESFLDWADDQDTAPEFDIEIPFFSEYLKIIGLCRSCSFPQNSECDVINTDSILEFVSGLFTCAESTLVIKTFKLSPVINNNQDDNTQVSLQSPRTYDKVSRALSCIEFNPGSLFLAVQPGGILHDPGGSVPDDEGRRCIYDDCGSGCRAQYDPGGERRVQEDSERDPCVHDDPGGGGHVHNDSEGGQHVPDDPGGGLCSRDDPGGETHAPDLGERCEPAPDPGKECEPASGEGCEPAQDPGGGYKSALEPGGGYKGATEPGGGLTIAPEPGGGYTLVPVPEGGYTHVPDKGGGILHVPDKGGGVPGVQDPGGSYPCLLERGGGYSRVHDPGSFPLVHDPGGEEKEEGISLSCKYNVFVLNCASVHRGPEDFKFCQIKMEIFNLM